MRFTRVRDLAGLTAAAGLVSWLVIRQLYGDLPPFPVFVPVTLVVLAAVEAGLGLQLRARIVRRPGTTPVPPLAAARALALAKASSLVGALAAGFWAGLLAYTVPRQDYLAAAGSDTRTGVVGVACALLLVGAALWLEYCCRAPRYPEHDHNRSPGRAG